MRKYTALVLLLSFIGLLWAQKDTCLQIDDEAVDVEEGTSDEQIGDIQHPNLLQLTPRNNFIYTQEYFTSEQDTTEIIGSDGFKWDRNLCCIGAGCFAMGFICAFLVMGQIISSAWH